jgi:hypothetical protein
MTHGVVVVIMILDTQPPKSDVCAKLAAAGLLSHKRHGCGVPALCAPNLLLLLLLLLLLCIPFNIPHSLTHHHVAARQVLHQQVEELVILLV